MLEVVGLRELTWTEGGGWRVAGGHMAQDQVLKCSEQGKGQRRRPRQSGQGAPRRGEGVCDVNRRVYPCRGFAPWRSLAGQLLRRPMASPGVMGTWAGSISFG